MSYYTVKKIYPWLYSIFDPQNVYCYLLVGSQKALLFDTVYGLAPLSDAIKEVTDKPVTVVLGHGHIDHVNGAYQFEEAWLHEDDFELCREHSSQDYRVNILSRLEDDKLPRGFNRDSYIQGGTGNLKKMAVGQVFDLGGLTVEAVGMEGHTAGSIGLLVREHKVLLDSDAANPHVWMYLAESLPISRYTAMLERTLELDFDTFFIGHSDTPLPKAEFKKYIKAAKNASVDKAKPYEAIPGLKGLLYHEDGVDIIFSERTLC